MSRFKRWWRSVTFIEALIIMTIVGIIVAVVLWAIAENKKPPCVKWSEPRTIMIPVQTGKTTTWIPTTTQECLERQKSKPKMAEDPNQE